MNKKAIALTQSLTLYNTVTVRLLPMKKKEMCHLKVFSSDSLHYKIICSLNFWWLLQAQHIYFNVYYRVRIWPKFCNALSKTAGFWLSLNVGKKKKRRIIVPEFYYDFKLPHTVWRAEQSADQPLQSFCC